MDEPRTESSELNPPDADNRELRSPVRPTHPFAPQEPPRRAAVPEDTDERPTNPEHPREALEQLRTRMESAAREFADGQINRAQFNAIYSKLGEQRAIIEKILEHDPNSSTWKSVASTIDTGFLRRHFQARLMYYLVYQHDNAAPLMMGGPQQPNLERMVDLLTQLWRMKNRPKSGLARKDMGSNQWLVVAMGEYAVTLALYMLEPSLAQMNLVRDLHADFERANRGSLGVGTRSLDRFVFPQRALTER